MSLPSAIGKDENSFPGSHYKSHGLPWPRSGDAAQAHRLSPGSLEILSHFENPLSSHEIKSAREKLSP